MMAPLPLTGVKVLTALNGHELFGHERGNIEVFKALRDEGAEVCVGVTQREDGGPVRAELQQLNFPTFPIPFGYQWSKTFFKKHPTLIFKNLRHLWLSNRAFAAQICSFQPTHIHLGNPLAYSYLSGAIRRSRLPLIIRLGDCPPSNSPVQLLLWRRFMNAAASVVTNSHYVWKTVASASPKLAAATPRIIHNQAPEGTQTPTAAHFDPSQRHVVYVGQLAREKGVFDLVEATALLAPEFPNLHVHLVGGSTYTTEIAQELTALITQHGLTNRVTLHGWINNARNFYRQAEVHVAPSLWEEPFCNVILEAKCEGTPSVTYPSGGIPEMIQHEVNGYLCPEKTPASLAAGIAWILNLPPGQGAQLRQAAADDYQSQFGPVRFRQAWAEVYLSPHPQL